MLDAESERGHVAETVAYDHVLRLAYKLNQSSPGHVSCFQGKRGEVDFVVELPRHSLKLPVEVKFRRDAGQLNGLYEFMERAGSKLAVVVTTDRLDLKEEVLFLPFWMFLLMC